MPLRTLPPAVPDPYPTDLAGLLALADYLRGLGARTCAVIAKARDYPAALAVVDAEEVEAFLIRFFATGTPAVWHARTRVRIELHGLDPIDADTAREVATMARGRWFWASDREPGRPFIDAATSPPQRGTARAERRRQERSA
jgi:hypothetical protein